MKLMLMLLHINKQPPLFFAVGQDKINLSKLLIKSGANIENGFIVYCSSKGLNNVAHYALMNNSKMKKPEFLLFKGENSKIWESHLKKMTFYLKDKKTGTQDYKERALKKIINNRDFTSLRYLSFFAYNENLNTDKIDNISNLHQVSNSH